MVRQVLALEEKRDVSEGRERSSPEWDERVDRGRESLGEVDSAAKLEEAE